MRRAGVAAGAVAGFAAGLADFAKAGANAVGVFAIDGIAFADGDVLPAEAIALTVGAVFAVGGIGFAAGGAFAVDAVAFDVVTLGARGAGLRAVSSIAGEPPVAAAAGAAPVLAADVPRFAGALREALIGVTVASASGGSISGLVGVERGGKGDGRA